MASVTEELKKIKETGEDIQEIATGEKSAALQKALIVGIAVFFFAVILFVVGVIVLAKVADRIHPGS